MQYLIGTNIIYLNVIWSTSFLILRAMFELRLHSQTAKKLSSSILIWARSLTDNYLLEMFETLYGYAETCTLYIHQKYDEQFGPKGYLRCQYYVQCLLFIQKRKEDFSE